MKKNKKIILLLVTTLCASSPFSAWAYSINLGGYVGTPNIDVNEILREVNQTGTDSVSGKMEDRYGFSNTFWEVAQRKVDAPRAEIFFDNTNPKPGEKVTARAVPEYFKNDPQKLYYTWYIINENLSKKDTITEGKEEAAMIMAKGDYDPDLDGQNYSDSGEDPDKDGWPAIDSNSYDEDRSAAPMGGSDGVGGIEDDSENIDATVSEYCGSRPNSSNCNLYTSTSSFSNYYRFSGTQSNEYCNTCSSQSLSWGTLSSDNNCCYLIQYPLGTGPDYDQNTSYCPTTYDSAYETCFGFAALRSTNESVINACLASAYSACEDEYDSFHDDMNNLEQGSSSEDYSRCFRHNFGINSNPLGFRGYEGSSNSYGNDGSGLDYATKCKHKWPKISGYKSGSGKFSTGEEKEWGTDPTDPDTDGDGFPDEADLIGLGQDSFTWTYQPGDRVGMVIEGTSMIPTDEENAYYKIMWGYLDICDSTKTGLMENDECDDSDDYGFGFLATKSPNEQGEDKLKVSLSFTPDNPIADPSNENKDNISSDGSIADADQISVISTLENTENNPGELFYTWQISKGDPAEDNWSEIKNISEKFDIASPTSGMGISQFSFIPKESALTEDGINYFKVTLTASYASGKKEGQGRSSVVVPINTDGVKISLYKVDIKNGKASVGDEICDEGLYKTLCPVVKGQMVAAKVTGKNYKSSDSEFAWKVSEVSSYEPANSSQLFDGWKDTIIFFPITKEEQQIEDVSVTVTSKEELQPVIGTRLLTVVHPAVFIRSSNSDISWPKTYTLQDPDMKDYNYDVASSTAFEAIAGKNASYYLDFVPYYLLRNDAETAIDWSLNGTSMNDSDFYTDNINIDSAEQSEDSHEFSFTVPQSLGSFNNLSVEVKKYWNEDERNISFQAWGIAPDTLSGDSAVSVESVSDPAENSISSSENPVQILAAIGTHLPHYFMYLLRLVLTMTVMFVVSAGFYGITQRISLINDEEK